MTKQIRCQVNYYRPQTKLREGNVFTPVCQSFCSPGGCLPLVGGGSATPRADTHRQTPSCPVHAGIHTPHCPVHAGIDTHSRPVHAGINNPPPRQVHGIRSTSGRYASHWNAFLFMFSVPFTIVFTLVLSVLWSYVRSLICMLSHTNKIPHHLSNFLCN